MKLRDVLVGIGAAIVGISVIIFFCFLTFELFDWMLKVIFGG